MPTYDYRCTACAHEFEEFQSMSAKPLRKCPACAKNTLERLIGTGAGIIFKGSGFYETDYRSESYKKAADADKPLASTPAESAQSCACGQKPKSECAGSNTTASTAKDAGAGKKPGSKTGAASPPAKP
ncbi:MAG: FmdB family zinc ribbon protein [Phycisphaerales bacterium]